MSISSVIWLSITNRVCLSNMYEVCLSITYEVLYNYFIERGCISVHNVPDLLLMILTLLVVYL